MRDEPLIKWCGAVIYGVIYDGQLPVFSDESRWLVSVNDVLKFPGAYIQGFPYYDFPKSYDFLFDTKEEAFAAIVCKLENAVDFAKSAVVAGEKRLEEYKNSAK